MLAKINLHGVQADRFDLSLAMKRSLLSRFTTSRIKKHTRPEKEVGLSNYASSDIQGLGDPALPAANVAS